MFTTYSPMVDMFPQFWRSFVLAGVALASEDIDDHELGALSNTAYQRA